MEDRKTCLRYTSACRSQWQEHNFTVHSPTTPFQFELIAFHCVLMCPVSLRPRCGVKAQVFCERLLQARYRCFVWSLLPLDSVQLSEGCFIPRILIQLQEAKRRNCPTSATINNYVSYFSISYGAKTYKDNYSGWQFWSAAPVIDSAFRLSTCVSWQNGNHLASTILQGMSSTVVTRIWLEVDFLLQVLSSQICESNRFFPKLVLNYKSIVTYF